MGPHNLTLLLPRAIPADFQRTRQLTADELEQDLLLPFIDMWPNALWYVVEFSYDLGETWEIINLFPLKVVSAAATP